MLPSHIRALKLFLLGLSYMHAYALALYPPKESVAYIALAEFLSFPIRVYFYMVSRVFAFLTPERFL
jgi:hypothetical protein